MLIGDQKKRIAYRAGHPAHSNSQSHSLQHTDMHALTYTHTQSGCIIISDIRLHRKKKQDNNNNNKKIRIIPIIIIVSMKIVIV